MRNFAQFNDSFDELATAIHQSNLDAGWWDEIPADMIYTKLMLVVTEIAEATEGERKDLFDDHLPHRKMGEVELADALIRIFDLAGYAGWVTEDPDETEKFVAMVMISTENHSIASRHLALVRVLTELTSATENAPDHIFMFYSLFVRLALRIGEDAGYDVMGALFEKWAYNETRLDHKRENRAKKNGKSF